MNGRDIKANQLRSVAVSSGRLEVLAAGLGWGVEEAYYLIKCRRYYKVVEVRQRYFISNGHKLEN